jgi:HEAT repeat protein
MSAHQQQALHEDDAVADARRRGDAAAAGHSGDEVAARRLLSDPAPGVRKSALAALVRMARVRLADLEAGLSDREASVRQRAAELAGKSPAAGLLPEGSMPRGPGGIATVLLARIDSEAFDEDPLVVEAICHALGELRETAATAALSAVARHHDDPLCREAAVAALGCLGEPDGLEVILQALSDRPAIRRRAVIALAPYDGPAVDSALNRALEDRDWQVRQAAEDLTGRSSGL